MLDRLIKVIARHPAVTVWLVFLSGIGVNLLIQFATHQSKMEMINGSIFQAAIVSVAIYLIWIWRYRKAITGNRLVISLLMLVAGGLLVTFSLNAIPENLSLFTFLIVGICIISAFWLQAKALRNN